MSDLVTQPAAPDNARYRVFKRTAQGWRKFASARKYTEAADLNYGAARDMCAALNKELSPGQKARGTCFEFERTN